jgi:extracellular factor (EF) 3-hydroxypalmitic acid methyl ester biosynthesis protein
MPEPLDVARMAAEQLVTDLAEARRITREWADARLTDELIDAALSGCLTRLAETGCWGEANRLPSSELWRIAGPILAKGVLQHRARAKPLGYAGDYQLLHWISTDYCCDDPLGGAFDRYFLRQAAPEAVRSRNEQTAAAMAEGCLERDSAGYHVVSVGSGPADDIRQAITRLPEERRRGLRVTLVDIDGEALQFAVEQVQPFLPCGAVHGVRENLFRLARRGRAEGVLQRPDLLVCPGLFDYLDDKTAGEMLSLLWRQLGDGGLLLVRNFAPSNPTRAYMEWVGNWYLIYRTAEDLRRLAIQAGIPEGQISIGCGPRGVDLFLMGLKRS